MDIEKGCLLRLSEAARNENQIQIALNSVIRAQRLEQSSSFAVLQEFSNVLWRQKEEQVAVQFLERLVSQGSNSSTNPTIGPAQKAVLLARLVRKYTVHHDSRSTNWILGYMVIGSMLKEFY
jgi:ataxia telangiectasia mutated family protein